MTTHTLKAEAKRKLDAALARYERAKKRKDTRAMSEARAQLKTARHAAMALGV